MYFLPMGARTSWSPEMVSLKCVVEPPESTRIVSSDTNEYEPPLNMPTTTEGPEKAPPGKNSSKLGRAREMARPSKLPSIPTLSHLPSRACWRSGTFFLPGVTTPCKLHAQVARGKL